MKLERVAIEGFRNLAQRVELDALGPVNVIHGDNDVGKSNILRAIYTFFSTLGPAATGPQLPLRRDKRFPLDEDRFKRVVGMPIDDAFNRQQPRPIVLECTFSVDPEELARAGIESLLPTQRVTIAVELTRLADRADVFIKKFVFADGTDAAGFEEHSDSASFAMRFAVFIARNLLLQDSESRPSFAFIDEHRRVLGIGRPPAIDFVDREVLLGLFDAYNSTSTVLNRKWHLFADILSSIPLLSGRSVMPVYDRHANEASLVFENDQGRMPLRLFGAGVQQIVALVGQLLLTSAHFVSIEEPECNLRYSTQREMRRILEQIASDDRGPSQIFLTSHSPAFEAGEYFYAVVAGANGPTVSRRRVQTAPAFLGIPDPNTPSDRNEAGYVSTDGWVRIPEVARSALQLEDGGHVVFLKKRDSKEVVIMREEEADGALSGKDG